MTLNKVLLVRVIHMTKQFWDKIGRFDSDKYAENVLKLECYKSDHAVLSDCVRRVGRLVGWQRIRLTIQTAHPICLLGIVIDQVKRVKKVKKGLQCIADTLLQRIFLLVLKWSCLIFYSHFSVTWTVKTPRKLPPKKIIETFFGNSL